MPALPVDFCRKSWRVVWGSEIRPDGPFGLAILDGSSRTGSRPGVGGTPSLLILSVMRVGSGYSAHFMRCRVGTVRTLRLRLVVGVVGHRRARGASVWACWCIVRCCAGHPGDSEGIYACAVCDALLGSSSRNTRGGAYLAVSPGCCFGTPCEGSRATGRPSPIIAALGHADAPRVDLASRVGGFPVGCDDRLVSRGFMPIGAVVSRGGIDFHRTLLITPTPSCGTERMRVPDAGPRTVLGV